MPEKKSKYKVWYESSVPDKHTGHDVRISCCECDVTV